MCIATKITKSCSEMVTKTKICDTIRTVVYNFGIIVCFSSPERGGVYLFDLIFEKIPPVCRKKPERRL